MPRNGAPYAFGARTGGWVLGVIPWPRGAEVVVRSRPDGVVAYCFPATVVADDGSRTALFQPGGTMCKRRGGVRGGPRGRTIVEWDGRYRDVATTRNTVHLHVAGDPFWVIRGWGAAGVTGWYINLAAPWTRFALGFDTEDHVLDVVVTDDRSSWHWKDQDELAWKVEHGTYSAIEPTRSGGTARRRSLGSRGASLHSTTSRGRPSRSTPRGWRRRPQRAGIGRSRSLSSRTSPSRRTWPRSTTPA